VTRVRDSFLVSGRLNKHTKDYHSREWGRLKKEEEGKGVQLPQQIEGRAEGLGEKKRLFRIRMAKKSAFWVEGSFQKKKRNEWGGVLGSAVTSGGGAARVRSKTDAANEGQGRTIRQLFENYSTPGEVGRKVRPLGRVRTHEPMISRNHLSPVERKEADKNIPSWPQRQRETGRPSAEDEERGGGGGKGEGGEGE